MKKKEEKKERKEEEKKESLASLKLYNIAAFILALLIAVVSTLVLLSFYPAPPAKNYITVPGDSVLIITHDEANLTPLYDFLDEHNISYYVYNVDHPVYYMHYGERNIPLMPPVVFVPAVICYDGNHLIGTAGYDLNAAERLVAKCYGLEVNR